MTRLRHAEFFRKKQAIICSEVQILLDLAHPDTPIQSTAVYFRAHTRKSSIHRLSQRHRRVSKHRNRIFGTFLLTNRHESSFERLTNCVGSKANKFFLTVKC